MPTPEELAALARKLGGVPVGDTPVPMNRALVNGVPVPVDDDPNTLGTVASHFGAQANPIPSIAALGQAMPLPRPLGGGVPLPQAVGGSGLDAGLVQAVKQTGQQQVAPLYQARDAYQKGDYVSAAIHALNYMIPFFGPGLDKAGNDFRAGKWAAGLGDALGISANLVGPEAVAQGANALSASRPMQRLAARADDMANARAAKMITPEVGANKTRFGNMAKEIAPNVARETTGLTRRAVGDSIETNFNKATEILDATADARLKTRTFHTAPVIQELQHALDKVTAKAVDASVYPPPEGTVPTTRAGQLGGLPDAPPTMVQDVPIGQDVVPAPNMPRAAVLQRAIKELQQLGPIAPYEELRKIRQAYDGPAKAIYSPSMTADFMAKTGEKMGSADVTGALREYLAKVEPETALANTDYSIWKSAKDVVDAANEVERVRPSIGRKIMAGLVGFGGGTAIGGALGGFVGAMLGPVLEQGAFAAGPAMRMFNARKLAQLADVIRAGDAPRAAAMLRGLRIANNAAAPQKPVNQEIQ